MGSTAVGKAGSVWGCKELHAKLFKRFESLVGKPKCPNKSSSDALYTQFYTFVCCGEQHPGGVILALFWGVSSMASSNIKQIRGILPLRLRVNSKPWVGVSPYLEEAGVKYSYELGDLGV